MSLSFVNEAPAAATLQGTTAPAARAEAPVRRAGRQRRAEPVTDRVRRDGKFFRLGAEKFYVKGVTYGPFAPNSEGLHLPERADVRRDFEQLAELGANCVRIYHVPPGWFLDLALEFGLKIFLDVCWPKNLAFCGDPEVTGQARSAVRECARACGNHPAVFAISVVNEIPPDIVRFSGAENVERFIDDLVAVAKAEAPNCLITFANFPTTEYLKPRDIDFVCFNVYLNDPSVFSNFLARLQNIAGELPLMLGEYGIDTMQQFSEEEQADVLSKHVKVAFEEGCCGTFVFSYTDDWFAHGWPVEVWGFGLTRRGRDGNGYRPKKLAFDSVRDMFRRVPQTADVKLPMVSVVVCSYNGASTVESCLRSMQRLKYPGGYEVIFVDDGSTDNTQEILRRFPWVKNIRQKNMGLSYARNVGMNAARGEVIAYTDSDCEADEDWLYFLALALVRSGHVGMGGPNLIPDEGSWVADCVGLSPGGPTHVMIDDRTAEHVPGCNMAFYTWALKLVNGFDPQYRAAGDDVDVIWRLQNLNYSIGFSPAAQVWHYRRNTVRAYLKQQRGYGVAEALLKYKHPDHFNTLGASHWRGKIYGGDSAMGVRVGRDVIYHGLFGSALFQTIYRKPASMALLMMMSIEWHLLAAFVTILGLALPALFWVALFMFLTPVALAGVAAMQAPAPRHRHPLSRLLIGYLHFRQPITRGWARYSVRLKAKAMQHGVRGMWPSRTLPWDPFDPQVLRYWSIHQGRLTLIDKIAQGVRDAGWKVRVDSGWGGWDMEVYGSRYVKVRLTTATEHHHHKGKLTRIRVQSLPSHFMLVLLGASTVLAGLLLLKMWPLSRTAVLIPLAWWSMYAVNRWRVTGPVLGMIDSIASGLNYWPVPSRTVPEGPACGETQAAGVAAVPAVPQAAAEPDRPLEDVLADGGQPSVA
jgi:glycosyltransferase involved in cell wall biosynthesis